MDAGDAINRTYKELFSIVDKVLTNSGADTPFGAPVQPFNEEMSGSDGL